MWSILLMMFKKLISFIAILSLCIPAYAGDTSNLEGAWLLDESSGTRIDETANSNDLTDNNTVTSTTGQFGSAGQFTAASSEFLSITDGSQTGLDVTGDITLGMWFNPDSISQQSLIGKTGSDRAYNLQLRAGGTIRCFTSSDGAAFDGDLESTTTLSAGGGWYHISCRVSSTTMTLRIDGSDEGTTDTTNGSINNSTEDFNIGANSSTANFADGQIDEAFIFSRALSTTEIDDIKDNGLESFIAPSRNRAVVIA